MTEIVGETRRTSDCGRAERLACFQLLRRLFLGVAWTDFVRDFDEKDAVMLLRDAGTGAIGGFSTVTELELVVTGERVPVVFSGDTAVLPEYRRSFGLVTTRTPSSSCARTAATSTATSSSAPRRSSPRTSRRS